MLAALIGDDERPDDIAVLAIRFAAPVVDDLRLVLPVDPGRPRRDARRSSGRGSRAGTVDEGGAAEAVLAVWEACANAIEHAQQSVAVVVQASGDGSTTPAGCGSRCGTAASGSRVTGSAERGLGLGLMRSFMDTVEVSPGDDGTAVVMERGVHVPDAV